MAPYVGAYSALTRSGLPVVSLHRSGFQRQLAGFRVLLLANTALLSEQLVEAVREFVQGGGGLICTHETSLYDENGTRRADFGLADVLGVHYGGVLPAAERSLRVVNASHPVTAPLRNVPAGCDEPHVIVQPAGAEVLAAARGAKAAQPEVPAILVHSFGKGRVVYFPGRPDAMQCEILSPWVERTLAAAVRWVAQEEPPVAIHADAMVGVTLFDQPGRRIVHLLNYHRDTRYQSDDVTPIRNVALEVALPPGRAVQRVHRLWSPAELRFTQAGGRARFALDELGEYEVVVLEMR
jgi:hypothetical protein